MTHCGQTLETLPGQAQILREAFNTEVNVETDPVETQDQGLIWYEVLDIIPQKLKTFEQVREVVAKDWRAAEERSQLASLSQKLVDRARKGEKLDEIASDLDLEVKQSEPFKRSAKSDDLPAAAMAQAFALSESGYGSASTEDGKTRVVFEVVAIDQPQTLGAEASDALENSFARQVAEDFLVQYVTGLSDVFGVIRNQPLIDELTGAAPSGTALPRRGLF